MASDARYPWLVVRTSALSLLVLFALGEAWAADGDPGASASDRLRALGESDLRTLLSAPSDKPRVVSFWASWCGPCRSELVMLDVFASAHPAVDVVLVSVDEPRDAPDVLRLLASTRLRSFQLGPDPASILTRAVADWPRMIPVTLVVDANGAELGRVVGAADEAQILAKLPASF